MDLFALSIYQVEGLDVTYFSSSSFYLEACIGVNEKVGAKLSITGTTLVESRGGIFYLEACIGVDEKVGEKLSITGTTSGRIMGRDWKDSVKISHYILM